MSDYFESLFADQSAMVISWPRGGLVDEVCREVPGGRYCLLTLENNLAKKQFLRSIPRGYSITHAFALGSPYAYTSARFAIAVLSPSSDSERAFKTGVFLVGAKEPSRCSSSEEGGGRDLPEGVLSEYLRQCSLFVAGGTPEASASWEFGETPFAELAPGRRDPSFYTAERKRFRVLLKNEETVPLSSVADLVFSKRADGPREEALVVKPSDLRYPFSKDSLGKGSPTTARIQPGDLLLQTMGEGRKALLVGDPDIGDDAVFASASITIIRPRGILPEYLYLYLTSDVAIKVLEASSTGSTIRRITQSALRDFPIIVPKLDDEHYRTRYAMVRSGSRGSYESFAEREAVQDSIESILDKEIAATIRAYNEEQLRSFLEGDLDELGICFRGGAYKAALILAGSILEAVLTDWVSEMHGKDYFKEDFCVPDRRRGGTKRADLIDLINEIEEIERPHWMAEAGKAHVIRKKRNLVHAKLCLREGAIDKEICREVISYLGDILKTRGVKSSDARESA